MRGLFGKVLGLRVQGLRVKLRDLGFRVRGFATKPRDLGIGVRGLGVRI